MKNKKFSIFETNIHPGETTYLALPLPEQYSCAPLYMPINIINGAKAGKTMLLFSVMKGNELNGLEIINRTLDSIKPDKISGTIIAIPVVNVYGLTHFPKTLPTHEVLANCFPGDAKGTYGQRIAHILTQEVFKKADFCIELQTGGLNHNILPQIYCDFNDKVAKASAKIFGTPVITNNNDITSQLKSTIEELSIPMLSYQAGEAMRFDESAISLGIRGIENVMKYLHILPKDLEKQSSPILSKDEEWITAHFGGVLHTKVSLGQKIEKGEVLGKISDPFRPNIAEEIKAYSDGIIVGINTSPLVYEGLGIFKLASFLDYEKAETTIEEWDKNQPDSYI